MLAEEVARQYGSQIRFAVEDFGASPLAERFGVDKYPAIFVDDALVARPEDFYAWGNPNPTGKYVPWSELENRRKFQRDLKRMLDIRLAGGEVTSAPKTAAATPTLPPLPPIELVDLEGKRFRFAAMHGKPTLVEFWAPWCPPCLTTMKWMKTLDPQKVSVVAIAVESDRKDVDKVVKDYQPRARVVMGTKEILDAFGGLPAVPTLVLADREGRIVRAFYGAPPNLHDEIEKELAKLGLSSR